MLLFMKNNVLEPRLKREAQLMVEEYDATDDEARKAELLQLLWAPIKVMGSEVFDIVAGWLSPDGITVTPFSLRFFDKSKATEPLLLKLEKSDKSDKERQISKEEWIGCARSLHDEKGVAGRMHMHGLLTKLLESFIYKKKNSAEMMAKKVANSLDTRNNRTVNIDEVKLLVSRLENKEPSEVNDAHPLVSAFGGVDTKAFITLIDSTSL